MTSRLLHRAACFAAALAFLAAPSVTHAEPIQGTTTGVFTNPVGGTNWSGTNTNHVQWGSPALGGSKNSLLYTGNPSINTVTGTPFKLGDLKFSNGGVWPSTDATSVDLAITLQLTVPPTSQGLPVETLTITNLVLLDEVSLPTSFSPVAFTVANVNYTLELLGFWETFVVFPYQSDKLTAFVSHNDTASLWGKITAEAVPVPEPASIAVVAIAGLFGLGHAIRRRRSAASA